MEKDQGNAPFNVILSWKRIRYNLPSLSLEMDKTSRGPRRLPTLKSFIPTRKYKIKLETVTGREGVFLHPILLNV